VTLREDRDEHALEEVVLADDDPLHFVEDPLHQRGDLVGFTTVSFMRVSPQVVPSKRPRGMKLPKSPRRQAATNGCPQNGRVAAPALERRNADGGRGALDRNANPMPMNTCSSVGFRMAVTMPTTSPSLVTSGPPELPGLAAASN
jgi:hypothetical protein